MIKFSLTILISIFFFQISFATKPPSVTKEELEEEYYPTNKEAVAAVLEESKKVFYEYKQDDGFFIKRKIYKKIKIYNKEGLNFAIQQILLWKTKTAEETVGKIKAKTYNLLNGKIEEFSMKKGGVFKDETSPDRNTVKFTLPNVAKGSVIEFSYTISSPFYTYFPTFYFQDYVPVKKQVLDIEIPEYFNYGMQTRGDKNINIIKGKKRDKITFRQAITETIGSGLGSVAKRTHSTYDVEFILNTYSLKSENVEAYKEESYVNNVYSYLPSVEFDLKSIKFPNSPIKYYSNTWEDVLKKQLDHPAFKDELGKTAYYKKDLNQLLLGLPNDQAKVNKIFDFVKNKMTWNNVSSSKAYSGVKNAYKNSTGSSGQINMILLSMLKQANINARPVFVSSMNTPIAIFPSYNAFDYIIVEVIMSDNSKVYLDATDKKSIPNILPERVIKGRGKVLTTSGVVIDIDLRPYTSTLNAILTYTVDNKGVITGAFKKRSKGYDAYVYRKKNKSDKAEALKQIKSTFSFSEITDYNRKGFNELSENINSEYKFRIDDFSTVVGDEIYFQPLLFLQTTNNPFKIDQRKFPIDYGYAKNEVYMMDITIPDGYVVSSLPESLRLDLPENLGSYKFSISSKGDLIQLKVNKKSNEPFIGINSYPLIKEFNSKLISKENEQIVLKKI